MPGSLHESLLDAMVARVAALDLDGTQARVSWRLLLNQTWQQNLVFPCVVVSPVGTEGPLQTGTLDGPDHTALPLTVRLLERDPIDDPARERALLKWRQTIREALRNQRLKAAAGNWLLVWQPGPTVEELPREYKLVSLPLVYQARVSEARDVA